jgi:dihydroorotase (multifunctional complex type)
LIVDSVLSNAKAYVKQEIVECSIAIEDGKIFKIGKGTHMPQADEKTNLHNLLVLPGVIDSHVHLRDEAKVHKETFLTGTAAAAAGGVTTVLDMPNNEPPTMSAEALRNRMQIAKRRVLVNVGFYSMFPPDLSEVPQIVAEGAVGFKLFMAEQIGALDIDDDDVLRDAFQSTGKLNVPVAVHAEDHQMLKRATEELKFNHRDDIAAFLKAHDESVEAEAVKRLLRISRQVDSMHLHFCHVSTEKALTSICEAKPAGKVTCEVTPHHLLLTKDAYNHLGTFAVTMPPLRSKENVEALWKGISEGTVDAVGSDHAPHTLSEKEARSIWDVKVGVPGLETILPLILTAIHKDRLTLARAVQLLAEKPAEVFHLTDRGSLEQGKNADLVVVDFNLKFKIDASEFQSKAKFSPFNGWEVQGKPVKTFINGALAMDEGEIVSKPGSGVVIRGEPK